jgi:hypothetical protein
MKKTRLAIIAAMIIVTAMFATQNAEAARDKIVTSAGGYSNYHKQHGKYYFCVDEKGNKYTIFIGIRGGVGKKDGHVVWIIGDNDDPENPPHIPDPVEIPVELLANTLVRQVEGSNEVIVSTDKPVEIQLIDLSTGQFVSERMQVEYDKTVNISNLSTGCKYGVAVFQNVEDYGYNHLNLHEFCKY